MAEADPSLDPEGLPRRVAQYAEWLRTNHFAEWTATTRERCLAHFVAWCVERSLLRPAEVTKPTLERYQAHLFHARRRRDGLPLSLATQRNFLGSVRAFFKWLARQDLVLSNPASDLAVPRLGGRLPKHVLSVEEVERVINLPDVSTPLGVRDRAILEVLYSTGMRRMELAALALYDIDFGRGTVTIREGKGRKQRVVPIGERAIAWVEKYVHEVRPTLVRDPDDGRVFLTHFLRPFLVDSLTQLVRHYVERAGLPKHGAVHLFRHTCATLMLEHGADTRYIQAMLGHAKLETTQIYTQVSIQKLKEVHTATHPAGLKPPAPPEETDATSPPSVASTSSHT